MSPLELAVDGPAAPPRSNGELVFDAPWQTRAFGLAAALSEQGHLSWSEFQQALIERVRRADESGDDTGRPETYWCCWLDALGQLTGRGRLVDPADWSARSDELAARPAGHDH